MGEACCVGDRGSREHGAGRSARRQRAMHRDELLPALCSRMNFPDRLPIPDDVLRIARRLEDAGYETWCVGGAIRDNLLGLENHDFDLTTAAPPQEVQRLFRRTVPVGIEHGTVAVLDKAGWPCRAPQRCRARSPPGPCAGTAAAPPGAAPRS